MALVSATIAVTFTSEYAGCNRVCYTLGNSAGYTCINGTCAGGGASCTVDIPITVDNETCPSVTFTGYVQSCCELVSSLEGRVPFSVTFTPSPSCKRYIATCNNVPLRSIVVTAGGGGYAVFTNPSVSFTGGGGAGATGYANVGTGFILTSNIFNSGSGYTASGIYTNVPLTGGAGTGAQATVTIAGGVVSLFTITNAGNGYLSTDSLSFSNASVGGAGSGAVIHITTDNGIVISVTLTSFGSGYTSTPGVVIAPGKAGNATAVANLGYCISDSESFPVVSCAGGSPTSPVLNNSLQPGQSVDFCTVGTPSSPAGYTIAQDTGSCLCNCQNATLSATGTTGVVNYKATICADSNGGSNSGKIVTGSISPTGSPSSLTSCMVSGSLITTTTGNAVAVITYNGNC